MSPRGYRSTLHGRTPAGFAPCGRGRDQHHGHHGAAAHGRRDGHQERHHGHLEAAELTACPRIRRLGAGTRPGASERNRRNPTQPVSAVGALEGHQRADSSETSSPVSWEALQRASKPHGALRTYFEPKKVTGVNKVPLEGLGTHPGVSYATSRPDPPRNSPANRAKCLPGGTFSWRRLSDGFRVATQLPALKIAHTGAHAPSPGSVEASPAPRRGV